jgi:hypothetical protein
MIDGLTLHASPSTCIGIVFDVTIFAERHWVIQVPWPPACNNGYSMGCANTLEVIENIIFSYF